MNVGGGKGCPTMRQRVIEEMRKKRQGVLNYHELTALVLGKSFTSNDGWRFDKTIQEMEREGILVRDGRTLVPYFTLTQP